MVKKRPCSIWQCRRPGDNVGHFLCAKALQQTHILPAKLMPPPLSHSLSLSLQHQDHQNKKERLSRRGNGLSEGTQPLVWLNRFQLEVVGCFRSNSNQNVRDWWLITWASFLPTQHFAYTVTRGCLQECSASVKTDSIKWGNLPMLPEHRPSTFQSLWAVSLT